jgi:phospholipid/cholesterol/gamma-HCH transport system substrate-binding protein
VSLLGSIERGNVFERTISTELKVGIFTVAALAAVGTLVLTLEGNPFTSRAQKFNTVLQNVGGVGPRTQVRTSGVQVGEVESIDILPKGAKVNFRVNGTIKIPKGSYIELRSRGILGDVYLEIVRNEESKEELESGAQIPQMKEFNDMGTLMSSLGSIAQDLQTVSRTLAKVFGTGDGQSTLQSIVSNVESITAEARDIVAGQKENISLTLEALRESVTRVNTMLGRHDGRIDEIMLAVADASKDMKVFSGELRKIMSGENKHRVENIIAALDDSMQSVRQATSKVQLIVDKVEKGEGTLGQLVAKDDTANELKMTLKSVQELLKPAAKLRIEVDYKGELRSSETQYVGDAGNHFNLRLATRPDRYYLLGVSDSPQSRRISEVRKTTTKDSTGAEVTREETTSSEDRTRIKYNVQFAKRFDNLGVRFGLFESYAGVAGDLYLFSDKLSTSIEVFQFGDDPSEAANRSKGKARVKGYANLFVTPNIYLTGGADNIGRSPKPIQFFGAGLRFSDDDLKAVIGAAALAK